ncbi:DUF1828 domain-containing protein [Burkholderia multivorans]|uniref:DUF1828 domain-containing protein n=1 Tax=Burkholderia multivorans TaxID=87883 RepID=UPI00158DD86C|nr:DUF1828 domain-containing protein [Burkholderia multivorans]MDR9240751.1 hypothetical protein [Burkholderia multivorans]MDR9266458.1 hypothetical protein [Burkholderia multivorans]MDR9287323.1 hypothetical protein [Burkholderia multivorans]MDR9289947.1 hypothetical protein [Burkholderia multivorans]MDR9312648.1 hypothetical protein [Burkholderia multivorans]
MEATTQLLQAELCKALCSEVSLQERSDGLVHVRTPFHFPDGDSFSMYLRRLPSGGFRISDMGGTLMHLSYEQDIDKLREGTRSRIFSQVLAEMGLVDEDGELVIEVPGDQLGAGVFRFGQALTRVHDLTFLNRVQVESTFYDDLYERITEVAGADRVQRDYAAPGVPDADRYLADFGIVTPRAPLLIFGVPSQAKARLATIVMQHLQMHHFKFRSMVVYSDMASISRTDVSRLTSVANDQVPSLSEAEALVRKIKEALEPS